MRYTHQRSVPPGSVERCNHAGNLGVMVMAEGRVAPESCRMADVSQQDPADIRLQAVLQTSRQVAWEMVPGQDRIRCSATATDILGLRLEQGAVATGTWNACVHPGDRSRRDAHLAAIRASGVSSRIEYRWRRPDDNVVIWVEESGRRIEPGPVGAPLVAGIVADINQRKVAEIERERFFTIGLDLMVVANFDGRLERLSPAWERALGWTTAELTSRPWLDFIHPDDHLASIAEAQKLYAGQDTAAFENRYLTKTGGWRWLSWKLVTYPEERLLYGAATDITERKLVLQRNAFLLALEEALRPLTSSDELIRVASHLIGEHLHADRCQHALIGSDQDSLILTSYALRPGIPPLAGRATLSSYGSGILRQWRERGFATSSDTETDDALTAVRPAFRSQQIRSHVSVPLYRDGHLVAAWSLHQTTPRIWQADEIDLLQRVADRCWESLERARAEAVVQDQWRLFDSALSHTPDFTYIFDLAGRFLYVNRALLSLWQKPLSEAIGRNFFELGYPADLAARLQRQIQDVVSSRQQVRDQTPFTGPSGATRHYEYIFVPIFSVDGAIEAVAGSTRDITDRIRSEDELRSLNSKLAHTNRELEQYAYIASHDLQEPLRMVSNFVMLLQHRAGAKLDQAERGYIDRAVEGTTRMQALIHDLLMYARAGEHAPFTAVSLDRIVALAIDHLKIRLEEASAEVTVAALPTIQGDELQLVQLFQNLIGNAIKFRDRRRTPVIVITATRKAGVWTVAVSDNGIGIGYDHRQRIFHIFQRLHSQSAYEGTGIGLAICKKIVEQHNGFIGLESQVGAGSTFLVSLPALPDLPDLPALPVQLGSSQG